MTIYGVVALAASVLSVAPVRALYWGGLYLSVFLVLEAVVTGERDSLKRSTQLLIFNWVVVAACAAALAVIARDMMFGREGRAFSGHGLINVIPDVGGFGMSRSTGIARFAAVPAIVAFARLCHGKGARRFLWAVVFCGFLTVVLAMQSRGAVLGLVAALAFVLFLQRGKVGLFLAVAAIALAVLGSATLPDAVREYVYKGRDVEALRTMTGRTEIWKQGWQLFLGSPIFGLGPLADRFHLDWAHIHNTWLFALMQAGIVGTTFFVASWVVAWRLFSRHVRNAAVLPAAHRYLLIEAGAVLAFFTVRSMPETTAAGFSVDLLIIAPILAYLETLNRTLACPSALACVKRRQGVVTFQTNPVSHPWPARAGRCNSLGRGARIND